jgi:hypothetical protein
MVKKSGKPSWVMINQAPRLALWVAVEAEVFGFDHNEVLTLG